MLTERQRKAQTLARELTAMGAFVTTPLPLGDNTNLRFQVLDAHAEEILRMLREAEFDAKYISSGPRFCLNYQTEPASVYEVAFSDAEDSDMGRPHSCS